MLRTKNRQDESFRPSLTGARTKEADLNANGNPAGKRPAARRDPYGMCLAKIAARFVAWAQRLRRTRMIREAIFDLGRATAIAGSAVVTLVFCRIQAT